VLAGFERPWSRSERNAHDGVRWRMHSSTEVRPRAGSGTAWTAACAGRGGALSRYGGYGTPRPTSSSRSHHEGSGYAVIEACACGARPVVTDIAPFSRDHRGRHASGITGRWATPRRLGRPDPRGRAARRRSRRVVLEHFKGALSWEAVGRRARAVYEAVIARRASREKTPRMPKLATSPCRAEQPTSNASNTTSDPRR
jgi:hypothetical protein